MKKNSLDRERLKLEKEKSERDFELREREIAIKEKEFNSRPRITTTQVTIWAALFGMLGTCLGALLQGYSNEKLQRSKFESELILKVATSDSFEQNKRNLKFFMEAGFITDEKGLIKRLVNESGFDLTIKTSKEQNGSQTKSFCFHNKPLIQIIKEIANNFHMRVALLEKIPPIRVSCYLSSGLSLSNMLDIILSDTKVNCEIRGNTILVYNLKTNGA